MALKKHGYNDEQVAEIVAYIDEHETIEGAPDLRKIGYVADLHIATGRGRQLLYGREHTRAIAADQRQRRAERCELRSDCKTDAAAAPGDHRRRALEGMRAARIVSPRSRCATSPQRGASALGRPGGAHRRNRGLS